MCAQVLKRDPATRILVTAPSNWAADLLATRMIGKFGPCAQYMMRISAYSRSYNDVDPLLLRPNDCCNWDEEGGLIWLACNSVVQRFALFLIGNVSLP
eukprot:162497-Pelagomonas_calceolata.AAC.1